MIYDPSKIKVQASRQSNVLEISFIFLACEQVRSSAERRARSLEPQDAKDVHIPDCDYETGGFKEVQCDPGQNTCYCVDLQGFEIAGTKVASRELVNCSNPNPCPGPMCRMLCPYGFQLDSTGCEVCECRNVCKGVKCPGETQCEVEEVPCTVDPCPPVPSCKQPRTLESLCIFGAPLLIPETGNPFLCGRDPGQPTCPAAFDCNVKTGDEYGVCCASNKNFEKPGSCPVVATTKNDVARADEVSCQSSCRHDLDCPDMNKCCFTEGCGKSCMQPANTTICQQQKHIAELLSQKEIEGKGYIPQCDENGNFIPRQCSRNGKICWCVSPDGKNFQQSLGPAESVNCSNIHQRQRAVISSRANHCDHVICSGTCEYGFKSDAEGCPTCDCNGSPCDLMKCPSGSVCEMASESGCMTSGESDECPKKATCLSESLYVNPCTMGTPLTQLGTQKVVACSESANTCPSSHICVMVSPNKAGLCCLNKPRIEPTKAGMCPFIAASVCNSSSTSGVAYKGCTSDDGCEHSMKCCSAGGDCTVCADPLLKQDLQKGTKMMTMCQYIDESVDKVGGVFSKFRLAIPRPQCKESGEFEEIQCDETNCICVDENGAEIPGTLVPKGQNNLTREACIEARTNPKCLEMNCRLGCDYGYEMLDGCKICECRNPCNGVNNLCQTGEQCEMVDIDCWDGNCPPLPFCVPESLANGDDLRNSCPKGTAFVLESNETLTCNPRARMLQCPDDFYCHDIEQAHDFGVCCPLEDEDFISLTAEERHGEDDEVDDHELDHDIEDHDINNEDEDYIDHHNDHFFTEGTNALARSDDSRVEMKMGQCPYLFPMSSGSCEAECGIDSECDGEKKCCVNSCGGTHCTQPLLLTGLTNTSHTFCLINKNIIEHVARENGIPAKRFFIPQCDENGEYMRIQSFGKFHWCVDSAGHEIQGTRVPYGKRPNCQRPSVCPLNRCSLQCEFGYQLDTSGCPVCQCKQSPCEDITCDKGEECRMMQLNCISEPCPPVPLCLPKLENPCPFGEPLRFMDSQERVTCGPGGSNSCPSSTKCHLSPFGEYAVCCPKPKEVCFEKPNFDSCITDDSTQTEKWFFNSSSNECQPTNYSSGCRGRGFNNLFDSKSECLTVCPALTHCERTREKNVQLKTLYQHFNYVPSCDPQTGEWNPSQCFDEIGMCWCVNKKGEPIKGTMSNGSPKCQTRRGRLLGASSSVEPLVCDKGITVHRCNASLCQGKICLGNPSAKCYINPCGGCQEKWMTEDGQIVDCNVGLTKCQQEMQRVVNSQSQRNQFVTMDADLAGGGAEEIVISESKGPMSSFENTLTEMFLSGSSKPQLKYDAEDEMEPESGPVTKSRTQVTPIYANFGDHKMIGLTASTVTYMSSPSLDSLSSSASSSSTPKSEEKDLNVLLGTTRKHTTATSIADILADMMRTESTEMSDQESMSSSDLIDLMPSSTQVVYKERALPPLGFMRMGMGFGYPPMNIPLTRVRREQKSSEESESHEESFSVEETSSNPEILVSIIPRRKPGSCPPPSHIAILNLIGGACRDECDHDNECDSGLKCCISKCGLKCMETSADEVVSMVREEMVPTSASESFPSYFQEDDYEDDLVEPPKMIPSVPQCSAYDNEYSPVQSQAELSWCVTPEGVPIHDTLTRGKVQCDRNGTVLFRQSLGPICPDPTVKPMVCTDQCLQTSCKMHPEAVCVMDVCDNCKPGFFRPSGEKVECEEKCSQPPADPGYCRAYMVRYTFNQTSASCEEFVFGGCQGNDNNFKTMGECQKECEQPIPVCQLPMKVGPCRASKPRWFFNAETESCESFWYSGCGGNANNFATKEQCENRCPDTVLCPYLLNGEMNSCSRTEACRNLTCINSMNPDEYICHVDPCTCEAALKDVSGNDITCSDDNVHSSQTVLPVEEEVTELPETSTDSVQVPNSELPQVKSQVLQVLADVSAMRSKCTAVAEVSRVKCDEQGQFTPVQCPYTNAKCHCVDEAGYQVENSPIFSLGSQTCEKVSVNKIQVLLNFPTSDEMNSLEVGVEMQDLLRKLDAKLNEDEVEVEVLPASTNLRFALVGDNKVDVSYNLEEMVKKNTIGVMEQGQFIPADSSLSRFTPIAAATKPPVILKIDTFRPLNTNELDDDSENDSVSAESLAVDSEYNVVAIMLTIVVAMSVLLACFGMFLALQKKKHTGSYPKKPFDSLAFSSHIYDFEKKVPLDLPTFKATPPNEKNEKNDSATNY
ncbi:BPTI/Kunitz domain-containing protein [Orchesella cincta]|uniref:BPTI/Kunitz domain-containing protein n=1 Tax=Orchesella cincta TaxID=48709 RepID=A0A1D2MHR1_ORCCI|nr:BPTI/Kunitz domain-containing protein [Orchesella cincta]